MSGSSKFPPIPGYDRTILRAYGLPRQMTLDEIAEVIEARNAKGKAAIQVTARSYEETLACLGLDDKQFTNVKGLSFLIGGEGASNFGKTVKKRGAAVVVMDQLYATPKSAMADRHLVFDWTDQNTATLVTPTEVFKRLPKKVVAGDLARLPFADRQFDAVLIHRRSAAGQSRLRPLQHRRRTAHPTRISARATRHPRSATQRRHGTGHAPRQYPHRAALEPRSGKLDISRASSLTFSVTLARRTHG